MRVELATGYEPRKTPVQKRSGVTVEALLEAAIQVLPKLGAARLTTTAVAARAGVSVGTLYQYFPNKQVLLHAVLERHLNQILDAVMRVCEQAHGAALAVMARALVSGFLDAKFERPEASAALYAVSLYPASGALQLRLSRRARAAIANMLASAGDAAFVDVDEAAAMVYAALSGASRAMLEGGPAKAMEAGLRKQLGVMCEAYLLAAATMLPDAGN